MGSAWRGGVQTKAGMGERGFSIPGLKEGDAPARRKHQGSAHTHSEFCGSGLKVSCAPGLPETRTCPREPPKPGPGGAGASQNPWTEGSEVF